MPQSQTRYNLHKYPDEGYRKLDVEIKRPSKRINVVSWVIGITWAVLFLLGVLLAYLKE